MTITIEALTGEGNITQDTTPPKGVASIEGPSKEQGGEHKPSSLPTEVGGLATVGVRAEIVATDQSGIASAGIGNLTVAATKINSTKGGGSGGVDPGWAERHLVNGRLRNFSPNEF